MTKKPVKTPRVVVGCKVLRPRGWSLVRPGPGAKRRSPGRRAIQYKAGAWTIVPGNGAYVARLSVGCSLPVVWMRSCTTLNVGK